MVFSVCVKSRKACVISNCVRGRNFEYSVPVSEAESTDFLLSEVKSTEYPILSSEAKSTDFLLSEAKSTEYPILSSETESTEYSVHVSVQKQKVLSILFMCTWSSFSALESETTEYSVPVTEAESTE